MMDRVQRASRVLQTACTAAGGKRPALTSMPGTGRPSCSCSHLPVSIGRVEIDAGCVTGAFEHVDEILGRDVAGRRRCERTAADAAETRIERSDAGGNRCVRIRDAGVARVVEVTAQWNPRYGGADTLHHLDDLRRHADADRVGERNLERLRFRDALRELDDARDRHLALERATERRRNGDLGAQSRSAGTRRDIEPGGHRFVGAHALVATVERVARDHGHADLVASGGRSALETLPVQHEPDVGDVVAAAEPAQHVLGIGHLRHALRVHEARDLDTPQAAVDGALDELDLDRRRHDARLALQAVARPDFDDLDASRHLPLSRSAPGSRHIKPAARIEHARRRPASLDRGRAARLQKPPSRGARRPQRNDT